jgi:hypothetical protein
MPTLALVAEANIRIESLDITGTEFVHDGKKVADGRLM